MERRHETNFENASLEEREDDNPSYGSREKAEAYKQNLRQERSKTNIADELSSLKKRIGEDVRRSHLEHEQFEERWRKMTPAEREELIKKRKQKSPE